MLESLTTSATQALPSPAISPRSERYNADLSVQNDIPAKSRARKIVMKRRRYRTETSNQFFRRPLTQNNVQFFAAISPPAARNVR